MNFEFVTTLPAEINATPLLISGEETKGLPGIFLLVHHKDRGTLVFEIRYEVHCSPFHDCYISEEILAVGWEEYFYLFNLTRETTVLRLKMKGYFGSLYTQSDCFYVADANGLYCIDQNGHIAWQNTTLGIDGVVIHAISDITITGSGEWDPPGGWRDFVLDKKTGKTI
jgi:hypothetical protein